jgi:hypothetical protein
MVERKADFREANHTLRVNRSTALYKAGNTLP